MSYRIYPGVIITTLLLGVITALTGCATTGMDRATKTTNSMQKVEEDYKHAAIQIDATRVALEDLVEPNQNDLKKAYEVYDTHVKKMPKVGKQLETHTNKMSNRNNEYLADWESSYTNPEIREQS